MALVAVALGRRERLRSRPGTVVVLPLVESADHRLHVGVPQVTHGLGGEGRPDSPGAVDDDRRRLVGQLPLDLELEVATGQVDGVGEAPCSYSSGSRTSRKVTPPPSSSACASAWSTSRMDFLASFSRSVEWHLKPPGHTRPSFHDRLQRVKHYQRGQHSRGEDAARRSTGGRLPGHGTARGDSPALHGSELLRRARRRRGSSTGFWGLRSARPPPATPGARSWVVLEGPRTQPCTSMPRPTRLGRPATRTGATASGAPRSCSWPTPRRSPTWPATGRPTRPPPGSEQEPRNRPSPTGTAMRPSASWRPFLPQWTPGSELRPRLLQRGGRTGGQARSPDGWRLFCAVALGRPDGRDHRSASLDSPARSTRTGSIGPGGERRPMGRRERRAAAALTTPC